MPLFYYKAINSKGKKAKGFMEAFDEKEAKSKLKEQGLFVTELSTKNTLLSKQSIGAEDLVNITSLMSQLVSSGIPLYESLLAIEEQYRGSKFHRILLSIAEQVKGGSRLSQAMATFPDSFDHLYVSMIASGESAGALDIVMEKLSILLNKKLKMKKEISTALIYPMILGGFALTVISVLLGFVIPSIEGIFEGRKLNGFTQFIIDLSHFARNWWPVFIPLIAVLIGLAIWQFRKPAMKLLALRYLIKFPLIGKILIEAAMSRFCRTMATLQLGGVSMIESLRLSRETLNNPTLEEEIAKAESKIIEGSRLSHELMRSRNIPHLVPRMLAIGEETGHLSLMLNKIADIYEDELDKTLTRTLALMQPVILIIMGFFVGLVLIAILLPLTDLSSLS